MHSLFLDLKIHFKPLFLTIILSFHNMDRISAVLILLAMAVDMSAIRYL